MEAVLCGGRSWGSCFASQCAEEQTTTLQVQPKGPFQAHFVSASSSSAPAGAVQHWHGRMPPRPPPGGCPLPGV